MKKAAAILLTVIMILSFTLCSVTAGAVGATTGEIDVVFLVDSSMSMKKSDPDNIRLEAIKLFTDLCSLGKTNIGFVLFGSEINYSQFPTPIYNEEDRANIKNIVSGLTETHGQTDIGKAVKRAVEILAGDGNSGNGKFIVFLSDGKTVINKSSDRTLEESEKDLEDGIALAQDSGIPIYTVGLNANGDVDEEQLRYISSSTYADDTYMTDDADNLSLILSDIYVRHTGAETTSLDRYLSDGEYHDIPFTITDSTVIEANIAVMHPGGLDDIKLYDENGAETAFDGKTASLSTSDNYSLVKLYYPGTGTRNISVRSPKDSSISVNCILTRDYFLKLTMLTDKAVGNGTKVKFSAVLNDLTGAPITDESILGRLTGKVTVTDSATGGIKDTLLKRENNEFRGEYTLAADDSFIVQASLYCENLNIRSELRLLDYGSEVFKEPESPLKMILIIAGSVIAFILIVVLIVRKLGENIKMWSGRLTVSGNTGGMPAPPAIFDFAKKVPGQRKITLYDVLSGSFGDGRAQQLMPRKLAESVSITMSRSGDIRISQVKDISYSGGMVSGKKTVIGSGSRATLKYTDKSAGMSNIVVIQYLRT